MKETIFKKLAWVAIAVSIAVLGRFLVVKIHKELTYRRYSEYSLSRHQDSPRIERAHELLNKLDAEQDPFMRSLHATEALHVLNEIVRENPDHAFEEELERLFDVQSIEAFEKDVVVPLKLSAGYGESPLMDAVFSWVEGRSEYYYDEMISKLFLSIGQTNHARMVLLKAFDRAKAVARHPRCRHEYGVSYDLMHLIDLCIELGETDLAYQFIPDYVMSCQRALFDEWNTVDSLIVLAAQYAYLERNADAEYYYDLAYQHFLIRMSERDARTTALGDLFRQYYCTDDGWHEAYDVMGNSMAIAFGYMRTGAYEKAEKVLTFIMGNKDRFDLFFIGRDISRLASLHMDLGHHEKADAMLQEEVSRLVDGERFFNHYLSDISAIARCYIAHDRENTAVQIMRQFAAAVPEEDVPFRCDIAEAALEMNIPQLVSDVLGPSTKGGYHKTYRKEEYRLGGILEVAKLYCEANGIEETKKLLNEAEAMLEDYADNSRALLNAYNDMAQMYTQLGMKAETLNCLEAVSGLLTVLASADTVISDYISMGFLYVELDEPALAEKAFDEALERYHTLETPDYSRSEYLAKIAIGFFKNDNMKKGMSILMDMMYPLAFEQEGSNRVRDLVGIAMLQANPKDPAAAAYWD